MITENTQNPVYGKKLINRSSIPCIVLFIPLIVHLLRQQLAVVLQCHPYMLVPAG